MTREEAKNWLNKLYARADITDEYGDMEDTQPYEEAVNMAIQALEQQPCDDAISRQAAIGIIQNWLNFDTGYSVGEKNVMKCAINELMDLPPVSTGKTGQWIEDENEMLVWCSKCGEEHEECSKYCPNCGAKMNVEECDNAISRQGEKNISKGFEDFMIKSLRKQGESESAE